MARYLATIQGNKGEVSRLGSKNSGIDATINGWYSGVRVMGRYNKETGKDEFSIFETSGSNYSKQDKLIAEIK